MDPDKARAQQDALADIYKQHGVKVHYVEEAREDRPNSLFCETWCSDARGAIIGRPLWRSGGAKSALSPRNWLNWASPSSRPSTGKGSSSAPALSGSIGDPS